MGEIPAADDASWPVRAAPLEEFLAVPRTQREIRQWGARGNLGLLLVDNILAWLRVRGRVVKHKPVGSKDELFQAVVPVAVVEPVAATAPVVEQAPAKRPEPATPHEAAKERTAAPAAPRKEPMQATVWLGTEEVAALLGGMHHSVVGQFYKRGQLGTERHKNGKSFTYAREAVDLLVAKRADGAPPEKSTRKRSSKASAKVAPKVRALVRHSAAREGLVGAARAVQDIEAISRKTVLLVDCASEGILPAAEALQRIRALHADG